jgi:TnpA family transposase
LVFALFDLLGLQFARRLAGLPDRRLYRTGPALDTPAGRLLAQPLNLDLIRHGWDELVRCAACLRDGTVRAARRSPPAPGQRASAGAWRG